MPKTATKEKKAKRAKKAAETKLATMAVTLPQPPTAEAIYEQIVKPLPTPERFKLAQLILTDIPSRAVVDYSEEWTEWVICIGRLSDRDRRAGARVPEASHHFPLKEMTHERGRRKWIGRRCKIT